MDYFELKRKKAEEQGKKFWYEAVLTDTEANVRLVQSSMKSCLMCKFLKTDDCTCHLGHSIIETSQGTQEKLQTCDEWRYCA